MTMTMAQIVAKTPLSRQKSAEYCRVHATKLQKTKYGTVVYKAQTSSSHDAQGSPHRGARQVYVSTVETNGKMTVVSCSCEDFKFTWEYALAQRKAARLLYCNGEPPIDRNPRLIPGCCKHLLVFGKSLIRQGRVA